VVAESAGNTAGGGQSENEGQNVLQLAIRSRFKFIYRPAGLGNRDAAAEKLTLTANGSSLAISNPTPFYITVSRISRDGGKALNSKTVMLAPQSSQTALSPPSTAARP
jgi:P pilus assembly chaperone PapD